MAKPALSVHRTGEWGEARRIFRGFAMKMRRATEKGFEEEAQASVRRIQNNIFAQHYDHTPLSKEWIERKDAEGLDPRILVASGSMVRAITSVRLNGKEWGVGVIGEEDAEKLRSHEFGIGNPERPVLRTELERIRNGRLPTIRESLNDVLYGRYGGLY